LRFPGLAAQISVRAYVALERGASVLKKLELALLLRHVADLFDLALVANHHCIGTGIFLADSLLVLTNGCRNPDLVRVDHVQELAPALVHLILKRDHVTHDPVAVVVPIDIGRLKDQRVFGVALVVDVWTGSGRLQLACEREDAAVPHSIDEMVMGVDPDPAALGVIPIGPLGLIVVGVEQR
jgi:hypothetical protein